MPAYISHAIAGNCVYDKLENDDKLLYVDIDKNQFVSFNIGSDLAYFSSKSDTHNVDTKLFFYYMINYIRDNKLYDNSQVMALLYGHMAHYFLDVNMHPFIYYIDKGCKKVNFIPVHKMIEGYIDSYLAEKVLEKDIMDIKPSYFNKMDLNNRYNKDVLSYAYFNTYNDIDAVNSYKITLSLFSLFEFYIMNNPLITKDLLIKFSGFKEFLKINNLTTSEIVNEGNDIWRNPVSGVKHTESLIQLFDKAIYDSIDAIYEINNYIYCNNISSFDKVFQNLSYDTGIDCNLKRKFIYSRKK